MDEIGKEVMKIAEERNIPALSLVIQTPDDSLHLNYHHPDLEAQTVYGIGSSTKLMVGVLVYHLAEQEKIDLNVTIDTYLDDSITDDFEELDNVTVKNLLNHTSGLADYTQNSSWITSAINNNAPLSFKDKIALVDSSLSNRGSFAYSNTNYLIIEHIVEQVTGDSYAEVLNQFYGEQELGT